MKTVSFELNNINNKNTLNKESKSLNNSKEKTLPLIQRSISTNNNRMIYNSRPHNVINPPRRFLPDYTPNSGINIKENFKTFMLKEIVHPIVKERATIYPSPKYNLENSKDKYALNYTLTCPNANLVPKIQQYKQYTFPYRDNTKADIYAKTYLKTDNIAVKYPSEEDLKNIKLNPKGSYIEMKKTFCPNTESGTSFVPKSHNKSVNNRSSVNYNIISFQKRDNSNTVGVLDRTINLRKKGVGEFDDLHHTFAINSYKKYNDAFKELSTRFRTKNGIFTHLYDSSIRNGKIIMPFVKDKIKK